MAGTRDFEILIFFENVRAGVWALLEAPSLLSPLGWILDIISV